MVEQFAGAHHLTLNVVDYLKTPLSLEQLSVLRNQLDGEVRDMVRDNEAEFAQLKLAEADDATLLQAIATHPKLLQRPIVVYQERAMIGRPPERLTGLLQSA